MTDAEKIENDLTILRSDRESLDEDIATAELAAARGESEPSLPPEGDPPAPAAASTPTAIPDDQGALIAEINRLDGEGKHAEAMPLKTRLLGIQSGYSGTSQPTPTPAETNAALSTRDELSQKIAEAESAGNWAAAGALKSRILQGQYK